MSSLLSEDMRQTFHVAKPAGPDFRGRESHGAPVPAACRCEPSGRLVRVAEGRQAVAEFVLLTESEVTVLDLVWPPGADATKIGQSRKPLKAVPVVDLETGQVDHYEVTL